MQEDWQRTGQLHHVVYNLHQLAWLTMAPGGGCPIEAQPGHPQP